MSKEFMTAVTRVWNPDGGAMNALLGLVGETGEVVELFKKRNYHGKQFTLEQLRDELGDVLYYVYAMCHEMMLDPEDVMQANIEKLAKRYPDGFALGGGIR